MGDDLNTLGLNVVLTGAEQAKAQLTGISGSVQELASKLANLGTSVQGAYTKLGDFGGVAEAAGNAFETQKITDFAGAATALGAGALSTLYFGLGKLSSNLRTALGDTLSLDHVFGDLSGSSAKLANELFEAALKTDQEAISFDEAEKKARALANATEDAEAATRKLRLEEEKRTADAENKGSGAKAIIGAGYDQKRAAIQKQVEDGTISKFEGDNQIADLNRAQKEDNAHQDVTAAQRAVDNNAADIKAKQEQLDQTDDGKLSAQNRGTSLAGARDALSKAQDAEMDARARAGQSRGVFGGVQDAEAARLKGAQIHREAMEKDVAEKEKDAKEAQEKQIEQEKKRAALQGEIDQKKIESTKAQQRLDNAKEAEKGVIAQNAGQASASNAADTQRGKDNATEFGRAAAQIFRESAAGLGHAGDNLQKAENREDKAEAAAEKKDARKEYKDAIARLKDANAAAHAKDGRLKIRSRGEGSLGPKSQHDYEDEFRGRRDPAGLDSEPKHMTPIASGADKTVSALAATGQSMNQIAAAVLELAKQAAAAAKDAKAAAATGAANQRMTGGGGGASS